MKLDWTEKEQRVGRIGLAIVGSLCAAMCAAVFYSIIALMIT